MPIHDPAPVQDASPPDPEDELLIDGQEEVFSRSEVELGRIEHHTAAGGQMSRPPQLSPVPPDGT